jgi:Flp pilus assembly protein TadG
MRMRIRVRSSLDARTCRKSALLRPVHEEHGAQILEFALSVPLLVLFIIGIFDFSNAISLKQKLTNAVRDGARVAASDPASDAGDSSTGLPVQVSDAVQVVDNYLLNEKLSDCGLSTQTPAQSGATLTWTVTATGCANGATTPLVLTINCGLLSAVGQTGTSLVTTSVSIKYPYIWQFTSVSGLFGGGFIPPSTITTTAIAMNEN